MFKSEASAEWQTLFINKVQCLVPYFTLENPLLLINKQFNKEGIKLLTKELVEVEQYDLKREVGDVEGRRYSCKTYYFEKCPIHTENAEYDGSESDISDTDFDYSSNIVKFKNKHFDIECNAAEYGDFIADYHLDVTIRNMLTQHVNKFDFDKHNSVRHRNCFTSLWSMCDLDEYIKVFACDRFIIVQTVNTQIVWDHESKRFNQYNDGQMKLRLPNMTLRDWQDMFPHNDMGYKASILISHDDYVVCFSKQD